MNIEFGIDTNGVRWAWTQGSDALQQQDVAVPIEGRTITVFRPGDPEARLDTAEPFTGLKYL